MIQSININIDTIIDFLQDEGLSSSLKIKNKESNNWKIFINDPFIEDHKQRLGIGPKVFDDDTIRIVFNGFKSSAVLGEDYHGDFYKFVKLIKNFDTITEAKIWFSKNYVLRGSNLLSNIKEFNSYSENNKKKKNYIGLQIIKNLILIKEHMNNLLNIFIKEKFLKKE